VQLLKRPKIIKLAILTALICGHGAVAQSEINSADSDLRQIRETFNVPDDDHGVLKVSKRVYESDEYGTSVTGIYVRVPYLYKDKLCVLEKHTKLGTKVDNVIQWRADSESVNLQYWFAATTGDCDVSSDEDVPNAVHVNDPIDIDSVLEIMEFERGLIQQAIARLDGAQFGEWMDSHLTEISIAERLQDLPVDGPFFGASYSLQFKTHGPVVYFRRVDDQFQIEKVGSWVF
jgi:hypothetical protein